MYQNIHDNLSYNPLGLGTYGFYHPQQQQQQQSAHPAPAQSRHQSQTPSSAPAQTTHTTTSVLPHTYPHSQTPIPVAQHSSSYHSYSSQHHSAAALGSGAFTHNENHSSFRAATNSTNSTTANDVVSTTSRANIGSLGAGISLASPIPPYLHHSHRSATPDFAAAATMASELSQHPSMSTNIASANGRKQNAANNGYEYTINNNTSTASTTSSSSKKTKKKAAAASQSVKTSAKSSKKKIKNDKRKSASSKRDTRRVQSASESSESESDSSVSESDRPPDSPDTSSYFYLSNPKRRELVEAFNEAFGVLPYRLSRELENCRRQVYKQQIGTYIFNPDVTLAGILLKARQIFTALDQHEHKTERDVIISLFGSELTREVATEIFGVSTWTIQRVNSKTKDGAEIVPYLQAWKDKVKIVKKEGEDGKTHTYSTSRTRNRICKRTGRSMREEKDIAIAYFSKPECLTMDVLSIFNLYTRDFQQGDLTKRAPLSRAHFYALAPDDRRRKAKPELIKVECDNCHRPMKLKVEEMEETYTRKKRGRKRRKKEETNNEDEGEEDPEDEGEVVTATRKRFKVEIVPRTEWSKFEAKEKEPKPPKEKDKDKTQSGDALMSVDDGEAPATKKRGRPRKQKVDNRLSTEMMSLLPYLPAPTSNLHAHEYRNQGTVNRNSARQGNGAAMQHIPLPNSIRSVLGSNPPMLGNTPMIPTSGPDLPITS